MIGKMTFYIRFFKIPLFFLLFLLISVSSVHSVLTPVGSAYNGGYVYQFVINSVHNKIYADSGEYLLTLDLYSDSGALANSGVPVQTIQCTTTFGYYVSTMALDVMKKKLYVGVGGGYGHIYIFDISDTGLILPNPVYHPHIAGIQQVNAIYLDFVHNLLVSCGNETSSLSTSFYGVVISQLNSAGMPSQTQGDSYNYGYHYGEAPMTMFADINLGKIYRGYKRYDYEKGSVVTIDANGRPILIPSTAAFNDYGGQSDFEYDPANKRTYCIKRNDQWQFNMWRMDDVGNPSSYDTMGPGFQATAIALDASRRKAFMTAYSPQKIIFYNLDSDGKLSTAIDSGSPGLYGWSIAYEPYYNKVYLGRVYTSTNGLMVYNGPDSAMTPIQINNGESYTETPYVTLKFQHANAHFIYVSGDLLTIGSPVGALNQWVNCGGGFWKNAGDAERASTLEVSAVLSSGTGEKTVEVWYSGKTTRCFTGMMRKATAKITVVESSASVSSLNLSRIDYSGTRIDYKVADGRDRNVNVSIQYRTADKDWTDATQKEGSGATGGGEVRTGLTASVSGISHYFLWDIEKDVAENAKDMQIRMKADNGDSPGIWVETTKYSVPDWTGSDLRAINVNIKKQDGTYAYRCRLEWSGASDTSNSYEVQQRENDGDWNFISSLSGTMLEVENLSDSPVYTFKVRLRIKEGLYSAFSKIVSIKLARRQYGTDRISSSGGKIYIEDFDNNPDNDARIEIEEGTFREPVTVVLEKYPGGTYEITGTKGNGVSLIENDFRKAVIIRLKYDKDEISERGWKEDELAILFFDGTNWICLGGKVDKTNSIITAKVRHFSTYKIGKIPDKQTVLINPDYFSPNNDGIRDVLYFYFTTQETVENAVIKIYDVNGKFMRVVKSDGSNTIFWDGKNDDGYLCETGIYICVIEAGNEKVTKSVSLVK